MFLELAVPAIIENSSNIKKVIHNPWGGVFTFGNWIPSGFYFLEDAADLSSPVNQEFGVPYTTKVICAMGGAYIHHHSMARHQYKNIATLEGVAIQLLLIQIRKDLLQTLSSY